MIKVKTKVGNIGLIEVPKLAFYFNWIGMEYDCGKLRIFWKTEDELTQSILTNFTSPNQFEILNKLSELDKELEEFVDRLSFSETGLSNAKEMYRYYLPTVGYPIISRKESFISLIKSQHPDFQEDKDYLLIKLL